MANMESAKKQARQNKKRYQKNLARKTAIKTALKKVLISLERGDSIEKSKEFLKEAEAKLARAGTKHVLHKNTARRKISRLAKKVSAASKSK